MGAPARLQALMPTSDQGSFASLWLCAGHFRFAPNIGRVAAPQYLTRRATEADSLISLLNNRRDGVGLGFVLADESVEPR